MALPKTILLVEDNPDDEALMLRAMKMNNISDDVVVAHDGVEAVQYLFSGTPSGSLDVKELPRVVLLDLNLPRLDGLAVLQRIRSDPATRLLPVVVLTSSKLQQDLIESYRLGANSYVRKPVNYDEFIKATSQLVGYWMGLNEAALS